MTYNGHITAIAIECLFNSVVVDMVHKVVLFSNSFFHTVTDNWKEGTYNVDQTITINRTVVELPKIITDLNRSCVALAESSLPILNEQPDGELNIKKSHDMYAWMYMQLEREFFNHRRTRWGCKGAVCPKQIGKPKIRVECLPKFGQIYLNSGRPTANFSVISAFNANSTVKFVPESVS